MSELGVTGKGTRLIIDICKSLGATQFLVQSSALAYYDPTQFESEDLELVSFKKPRYIYACRPISTFEHVMPLLAQACRSFKPFEVQLARFELLLTLAGMPRSIF